MNEKKLHYFQGRSMHDDTLIQYQISEATKFNGSFDTDELQCLYTTAAAAPGDFTRLPHEILTRSS